MKNKFFLNLIIFALIFLNSNLKAETVFFDSKNIKIDKPWFLSGGINLDNIETIKTEIKAFGIDLSSGVEKKLGIKDNQIINNFIGKLNNA